jgi:hypothetical protein
MIKTVKTAELIQCDIDCLDSRIWIGGVSGDTVGLFAQFAQSGIEVLRLASHCDDPRARFPKSSRRRQTQAGGSAHHHDHLLREPHSTL